MVETVPAPRGYPLPSGDAELERLQIQARVWEPEAEIFLDRVGIQGGWSCLDIGCGAMGILGPLSRRVGPSGRVLGIDVDSVQLQAAASYIARALLVNVSVEERDAFHTRLPSDSFHFVHARFLAAPTGRGDELLQEMVRLARPGGIVALEEPDTSSWRCYPENPAFERLCATVEAAFARGGGDLNAGRQSFRTLHAAGLEDVDVRTAVLGLSGRHPYKRLPSQFAVSLRPRILEAGLMDEAELDASIAECNRLADDPEALVVSFLLHQVWGRKPDGRS